MFQPECVFCRFSFCTLCVLLICSSVFSKCNADGDVNLTLNANASAGTVTYKEITVDLRLDIQYYLHKLGGDFTVGNLVRYGFHTCVTGCDGCINMNNRANSGLDPSFDALRALYIDPHLPSRVIWSTKIANLADFWSICSTVANLIALPRSGEHAIYVPEFKFWVGRTTCATSPNQTIMAHFPDSRMGLTTQSQYFGQVFGLTQPQYIALIGAHTLGFAHSYATGYDTLAWTDTPTVLDNRFYIGVMDRTWIQTTAAVNGRYEWEIDDLFMFNSDVCIYKNLLVINDSNGKVPCTYDECPVRPETQPQIQSYIKNETLWLDEYAIAWNIMMLAQCDVQSLTPVLPDPTTTME